DLIDESFRHDTVVHVTGADRAAVIRRRLEFAFRNTPYRQGKIIGRAEEGRRDDRLMMSAINKPDSVEPWIQVLTTQERAVQSLTSTAFLLQHYVALEKLHGENHLLISNLEANHNLRQSFFHKGQLLFSRLTTIARHSGTTLGSDIYLETLQVRQYLERVQFIPFEARLRIQLFSGFDEDALQLEAKSSENNQFEVIPVMEAAQDEGDSQTPGGPTHHQLARVLAGSQPDNVYASAAIRRFHTLRNHASRARWAAGLILVLGLSLQVPDLQALLDTRAQTTVFTNRTAPLRLQYQARSAAQPQLAVSPAEMALIVETHARLEAQSHHVGIDLNMAADALALAPGLALGAVGWQLNQSTFKPFADRLGNLQSTPPPLSNVAAADPLLAAQLSNSTGIRLQINGEAYSPGSFREAQQQVQAYITALQNYPGVNVSASRMPTDVRTNIDVSTTVNDGEVRAPFTLDLSIDPSLRAAAGGQP
ncbi:MAG TPA: hypothetical protein VNR18_13960, partial [Hyphomicrobiales bacterium]|nr:hypothetical protein [Hyphomicrobiales bacterium]